VRFHTVDITPKDLDDELLDAMQAAGFAGVGVTVESAADPVLRGLKKDFDAAAVHRAAETIARHDLPVLWGMAFGGPGETRETVDTSLQFIADAVQPADTVFASAGWRIYPGTELERIARAQGALNVSPQEMLEPVFYLSPDIDPAWLRQRLRRAASAFLNFSTGAAIALPWLPAIQRTMYRLGARPPIWRHVRPVRRLLRLAGTDPC
jgi:radical SAM superfamily enzyme YgiQ (UPF0313 family)